MCRVCNMMVSVLVWSSCDGTGRHSFCCGGMTGELAEDLLITGCGEQWFTVVGMFLSVTISRLTPGPTEGLKEARV